MPEADLGCHPADDGKPDGASGTHNISFYCDDIHKTVAELRAKGVRVEGEPESEDFGITVMLNLPGDCRVMLYEPRHETAIGAAKR